MDPSQQIAIINKKIEELNNKINDNRIKINSIDSDLEKNQLEQKQLNDELRQLKVEVGTLSMKLNINSQHNNIKQFLLSLVKDDNESEQLINKMRNDSELSKTEMYKIVKAFMAQSQSKGYEIESNISDSDIQELMENDQKEFEEIIKMYQALKEQIKKFKDLEFDLVALQKKVNDKQNRKEEIQRKLEQITKNLKRFFDSKNDLENNSKNAKDEIDRLYSQIDSLSSKDSANKSFLNEAEQKLNDLLFEKNQLESKNKVY